MQQEQQTWRAVFLTPADLASRKEERVRLCCRTGSSWALCPGAGQLTGRCRCFRRAGSAGSGQLRKQALLLFTACRTSVNFFLIVHLFCPPYLMFQWLLLLFFSLPLTALSPPLSPIYLLPFLSIHLSSCFH